MKNFIASIFAFGITFLSWGQNLSGRSNMQLETTTSLDEKVDWNNTNKQSTYFIENKGQIKRINGQSASDVKFLYQKGGTNIYLLEQGGIAFQFQKTHFPQSWDSIMSNRYKESDQLDKILQLNNEIRFESYRMDMVLEGANPNATISTKGKSKDYFIFNQNNPIQAHHYGWVVYENIYPNIDWEIYVNKDGSIKYDFHVHPGGDPSQIKLKFSNHEALYIDENGNLIHGNRMGQFIENAPISFQEETSIPTKFVLKSNILSFELADYDRKSTLIIDPLRVWGTYYGGHGDDRGMSCAVDNDNFVYLSGYTSSNSAIANSGYQNTYGGNFDAFLVKFNASGVRQWATYFGGSDLDFSYSCTIDNSNNVYLAGLTTSTNLNSNAGHQNTFGGGGVDAFLAKFNSSGAILWSTYYGDAGNDVGRHCIVDGQNNVYLAGYTNSSDNIASNGQQNTFGGGAHDAFLVKFDEFGNQMWATYYGGSLDDRAFGCAIDSDENVYLTGYTASQNNIAFNGQYSSFLGGQRDAFLAKFDSNGARIWSTYCGGENLDESYYCSVDSNDNVYIVGSTKSLNNISQNGFQNSNAGGYFDAFLMKFSSQGSRIWSTYYGGSDWDEFYSCTSVDNNLFVAGYSRSSGLAHNGYQNSRGGGFDGLLVKFDTDGSRIWSTYYGGLGWEESYICAADPNGYIYLSGYTESTNNIAGGDNTHQINADTDKDAFLAKFSFSNCTVLSQTNKTICKDLYDSWFVLTYAATGIGSAVGLPLGISVHLSGDSIIFSGTSNSPGIYQYSIPIYGLECFNIFATGEITVVEDCAFVTHWNLSLGAGSGANSIQIYIANSSNVNYEWEEISPGNSSGSGFFTFGTGFKTVSGLPTNSTIRLKVSHVGLNELTPSSNDKIRLVDVESWGLVKWTGLNFSNCINLDISAADLPDLSVLNDLSYSFSECTSLTGPTNINQWDVSNVEFMTGLFYGALNFNQPLGNWDVQNVKSTAVMFYNTPQFNQDLNSWNTSSLINANGMFAFATSFNQSLSNWSFPSNVLINQILDYSGLDCENYAETLMGWQQNNPMLMNRQLGAANLSHTIQASAAKNILINQQGWTINDSGIGSCEQFETLWNMSQFSMNPDEIYFNADITGLGAQFTWEQVPSGASGSGVITPGNGLKVIDGLPSSGLVKISIKSANIQRFYMGAGTSTSHLVDVLRWGDVQWTSMENAFHGCNNLQITAPYPPFLSQVSNMKNMFRGCTSLSNVSNINSWDVSTVTNMEGLFRDASNFNNDITSWNTSNVTNMSSMFLNAANFNQPIGAWNTQSVTDMSLMFYGATNFNEELNTWNTNSVTNMSGMFYGASSFNKPLNNWNTNSVTNMAGMFAEASNFNQDISLWSTAQVNNMSNMFYFATSFNKPLNNWNVSSVNNMENMFLGASTFNQSLMNWNVQNVQNMIGMFGLASTFNQNIGAWTLHPNVNLSVMLFNSGLDCFNYASTLAGWAANNPTVTNRNLGATGLNFAQFGNQARNTLINSRGWTITDAGQTNCGEFVIYWTMAQPGAHPNQLNFNVGFTDSLQYTWIHVGGNTSGTGYFTGQGAQTLTGIPTNADVRLVLRPQNLEHFSINNGPDRKRFYQVERWGNAVWKNMEGMFYGCDVPEDITLSGFPNTSQVSSMKNMFRNCTNMMTIGSPWLWDVSSVTNMESMFQNCPNFNDEIDAWDVSDVVNMKSMFEGATLFNWDISQWNVSNVSNFSAMFKGASSFNQWLNDWQTVSATNMSEMFRDATQYEFDLDSWQTGQVTNMSNMFRGATNFQGMIANWNTENVTDMSGMFFGATAFNNNISNWNTAQVTSMSDMFRNASSFNMELNDWDVGQVNNFRRMFMNATQFNRSLHNWNTSSGTDFSNMFNGASNFDGEVNTWDMSAAATLHGMFANTQQFNREIGTWNLPLVQDMSAMFKNTAIFNRDLSAWNFPTASNLSEMFSGALQFNQDLSDWEVIVVQELIGMFQGAASFNQNLGAWNFNQNVDLNGLLDYCGIDCNNYSATLSGWSVNNPYVSSVNLGASGLAYATLGQSARDVLVNTQGWNISGDFFQSSNPYILNEGETFTAQMSCYGDLVRDDAPGERLILLDPNGNSMDWNSVSAQVTNTFVTPGYPDINTHPSTGSGYYEITDGVNTFRVGRRLFKIEAPGNYTVNGGVRVRLYFDPNDFTGLITDPAPNSIITNYGWFKSSINDFQSAIDEMNASPLQLPSAIEVFPTYGNENGADYAEFVVQNFSVFGIFSKTTNGSLPVSLTAFNAHCQGENIQLSWSTASEFNASHYNIHMSRDGFTWNNLGRVEAVGITNHTTNYSFEIQNFGGLNYFRLEQVDLDGKTEIFGPVSSDCKSDLKLISVSPNPSSDFFNVEIQTNENLGQNTIQLLDLSGRVVLIQDVEINNGNTSVKLNIHELKSGVYMLSVTNHHEKFNPLRVVKL